MRFNRGMTTQTATPQAGFFTRNRLTLALMAIVFIAVAVAAIVVQQRNTAAEDRKVDEYYCTLSGISPFDTGPNTGELCIELLG